MSELILYTMKSYKDERGEFVQAYREDMNLPVKFVEDDFSISRRDVLRGLHGDGKTWKLVSCIYGQIFFVAVDPETKKWKSLMLNEQNLRQVLVPPNYAMGYLILSELAIVHYKQSILYGTTTQFTLRWDDPTLGIDWPISKPILSERDAHA
jgi:dTDP-4-dehydrorhamnose 3,5-epimerase